MGLHLLDHEARPRHVGIVTDGFLECRQWGETSSGMKILDECGHGSDGIGISGDMLVLCVVVDGSLCWYGEQVQVSGWVHYPCEHMLALHGGHINFVSAKVDLAPCLT